MATQTINTGTTTFGAASAGDSFYIRRGGQSITGNADYSGVNTSVLAEISSGFTGQIGTSADPWKTAFSSYLWYGARAGDLYFESNALDTETTALIRHTGLGHLHVQGATAVVTRLDTAGTTTVANGVTVTTAYCGGYGVPVTFLDTGTGPTITTLYVNGSSVISERPHTTINAGTGSLVLRADSAHGLNAHGTINIYGGCKVTILDSGTITTLLALGSVPDVSMMTQTLTITNTTINMNLPGAQAFLDNPQVTFTNAATRIFSDGRQL